MTVPTSNRGWNTPAAVTLEDVAREAGLSVTTASRVLNGSVRRVPDASRSRVEAAARRLGYAVNRSAQAVARGASDSIALLVPDISDPYFSEIAAGVARGADEIGLLINIGITGRDHERARDLIEALRGQRPRGVILSSPIAPASATTGVDGVGGLDGLSGVEGVDELRDALAGRGRVVTLGRGRERMHDSGSEHVRRVLIDDRDGARRLARELRHRGYDRAVILSTERASLAEQDRVDGFTEGFAEDAGDVFDVMAGVSTRESGRQLMQRLLAEHVAPGTVVFAVSDVMAIGAFSALRESGRRVGADIALAGFGDTSMGRDLEPGLTTVRVPLAMAGYHAFRAIVDDDWRCRPDLLELRVVIRGSTPRRRGDM